MKNYWQLVLLMWTNIQLNDLNKYKKLNTK